MGPIFTASEEEEHDASHEKIYVNLLDGQQRITTLVIISRVLVALENYNGGIEYDLLGELEQFQKNGEKCDEKINEFKKKRKKNIKFLENILFYESPGESTISKFQTDISCREDLEKWILNLNKINNEQIESSETSTYDKFRDLDTSESNDFQITKKTLNENISIIYEYFENLIDNGKEDLGEGAANGIYLLNQFTDFIITRLYFIHIPLVEKNDILDIFESINNRGKKLNLTDIIKFKTIKDYINDETKQKKVNSEWSKLYKTLGEEDVFKVLMIS